VTRPEDDTRNALRRLAEAVAWGELGEEDVEDDLRQLCGDRGDLRAFYRRALADLRR